MDIKTHDKKKLWLRTELASGKTEEGEEFSVGLNINGGSLIFMFPEATYTIMLRSIVDDVMAFRRKQLEANADEKKGPN